MRINPWMALGLGLSLMPAFAQAAYPYYYNAPPAFASPSAAALGPWAWNFNFGGGPSPVVGSARNDLKDGYNFTFGGGYNFSPRAGFVLEFMNTGLDVTDRSLQDHQAVDGNAFIRSVTLNPIWRFRIAGPIGGYVIGGGGYYQREEHFSEPVQVFVPTYHGGYYASGYDDVREYDNTGGVNAGLGFTWNMGWGTKLYVEARYHYIFTSGKPTQIVPVTFGFRW